MSETKIYKSKGETYNVPTDRVESFLAAMPDAVEHKSYISGVDTFDVPIDRVESFLAAMPDAKLNDNILIEESPKSGTQKKSGFSMDMEQAISAIPTKQSAKPRQSIMADGSATIPINEMQSYLYDDGLDLQWSGGKSSQAIRTENERIGNRREKQLNIIDKRKSEFESKVRKQNEVKDAEINANYSYPTQIAASFIQGIAPMVSEASRSVAILANQIDDLEGNFFNEGNDKRVTDYATYKFADYINKLVEDLPVNTDIKQSIAGKLATGGGSLAGFAGAGIAGKFLKGVSVFGKVTPLVTTAIAGATSQGGSGYAAAYERVSDANQLQPEEYIEKYSNSYDVDPKVLLSEKQKLSQGVPEDVAFNVFLTDGLIGTTEALPIWGWLERINKATNGQLGRTFAGSVVKGIKKGFIEEGVQEAFTTAASNYTAQQMYDMTRNVTDGVLEAGTLGGILGSSLNGITNAITYKKSITTDPKELEILEAAQGVVDRLSNETKDVAPNDIIGGTIESDNVTKLQQKKAKIEQNMTNEQLPEEIKQALFEETIAIDEKIVAEKELSKPNIIKDDLHYRMANVADNLDRMSDNELLSEESKLALKDKSEKIRSQYTIKAPKIKVEEQPVSEPINLSYDRLDKQESLKSGTQYESTNSKTDITGGDNVLPSDEQVQVKGEEVKVVDEKQVEAEVAKDSPKSGTPELGSAFTYDINGDIVEAEVVKAGKDTSQVIVNGKRTVRVNTEIFNSKEEAQKRDANDKRFSDNEAVKGNEREVVKDKESKDDKAVEGDGVVGKENLDLTEVKESVKEPEFNSWRVVGSKIIKSVVGGKLTESEANNIVNQIKTHEDKIIDPKYPTPPDYEFKDGVIRVRYTETEGNINKWLSNVRNIKDKDVSADKALEKRNQKSDADKKVLGEVLNRKGESDWIDMIFGKESMNNSNKLSLIKYINGESKKFEGLPSNTWIKGLQKIGAIKDSNPDFVKIKESYEQYKSNINKAVEGDGGDKKGDLAEKKPKEGKADIAVPENQKSDTPKAETKVDGDNSVGGDVEGELSPLQKELQKANAPQKLIDAVPKDTKLREGFLTDTKRLVESLLGLAGNYSIKENKVRVGKFYSFLFGGRDKVLIHEAAHAATMSVYGDILRNEGDYTKEQVAAARDLNDIAWKYLENTQSWAKMTFPRLYGTTNPYEFIAEFIANPKFRDYVSKNSPDKKTNISTYIWDGILKMLGVKKSEINQELIDKIQNGIDATLEVSAAKNKSVEQSLKEQPKAENKVDGDNSVGGEVMVEKTDKGNIKLTSKNKEGKITGELKTQRNNRDKELNTVSITEVRSNEYNRKEGVATKLYQKLLGELPSDVYGIRMSDIVNSDAIPKIYEKMGAVKENGETIIKNPNYKPSEQSIKEQPKAQTKVDGDNSVGGDVDRKKVLKVYPELKDTKVTNEDGTPKIVYHGGRIFDGFKIPESEVDKGIYFTDNLDFALYFAHQAELVERDKRGDDYSDIPNDFLESGEPFPEKYLKYAKVHKAYLDMKNPKTVDAIDAASIPKNYEKGKDGFIAKATGDFGYKGGQYVVFDPKQIKNAEQGVEAKVAEVIVKAKRVVKKSPNNAIAEKRLKEDKADIVNKLLVIERILLGDKSKEYAENAINNKSYSQEQYKTNLIKENIESHGEDLTILNRELKKHDARINADGSLEMIFPNGRVKFLATDIGRIKTEVEKNYPTKVEKGGKGGEARLTQPKRTAVGNYEQVAKSKRSLINAEENLAEAERIGKKPLIEIFKEQLDIEKSAHDNARNNFAYGERSRILDAIDESHAKELGVLNNKAEEEKSEIDRIKYLKGKGYRDKLYDAEAKLSWTNKLIKDLEGNIQAEKSPYLTDEWLENRNKEWDSTLPEDIDNVINNIQNGNITEQQVEAYTEQDESIIEAAERKAEAANEIGEIKEGIKQIDEVIDSPKPGTPKFSANEKEKTSGNESPTKQNISEKYPDAIVVKSENELPQNIKDEAKKNNLTGKVKAVYDPLTGSVFIVSNAMNNMADVDAAYRHEALGHKKVIEKVGAALDTLAINIVNNATPAQNKVINDIVKTYFTGKKQSELTNEEKSIVGQEYIARIAETPTLDATTFDKVKKAINDILRALGFNINISDKEIKVLINNVEKSNINYVAKAQAKVVNKLNELLTVFGKGFAPLRGVRIANPLFSASDNLLQQIQQENKEARARKRNIYRKEFGEKVADALLKNVTGVSNSPTYTPQQLVEYIKNRWGDPSQLTTVIKEQGLFFENDFIDYIGKKETTANKSTKNPNDLLNDVGYTMSVETDLGTAQQKYLPYYKGGKGSDGGEGICTLNDGSGRFRDSFVTFFVKNNAKETPHALSLTQDNLTPEWKSYLETKGKKKADGTFDLSGIRPNELDPYSTSVMCVQIHKIGKTLKVISRYNHTVSSPDNIYRDLDDIAKELHSSFYDYFKIELNNDQRKRIPSGYQKDSNGKIWKFEEEKNGVYYGQGFYIRGGVSTKLNPGTERMVDGYVLKNNGQIENIANTLSFPINDIKKILFLPNNAIRIEAGKGVIEFPVRNGIAQQNTFIDKDISVDYFLRTQAKGTINEDGKITIEDLSGKDILYFHRDIVSVRGSVNISANATLDAPQLQTVRGYVNISTNANLYAPQLQTVGGSVDISANATLYAPQLQTVGWDVDISTNANLYAPQLQTVGRSLNISANATLDAPQLQTIGRSVDIRLNATIDVPQIQTVGGSVNISTNATLDAPQLQTVGGYVNISTNATLDAPQLQTVGGDVDIRENSTLDAPKTFIKNDTNNQAKVISGKTIEIYKDASELFTESIKNKEGKTLNDFLPKEYKSKASQQQEAEQRLEDAKKAFSKASKNMNFGGLSSVPEFIELVMAHINLGAINLKEFIKELRKEYPTLKYNDQEIEDAFYIVKQENRNKGFENRAFESTAANLDQLLKEKIGDLGLSYPIENWKVAEQKAQDLVDAVGIDKAIQAVRDGKINIESAVNAAVYGIAIEQTRMDAYNETSDEKKSELYDKVSDFIDELGRRVRGGGREASYINYLIQNSDMGYSVGAVRTKGKQANKGKELLIADKVELDEIAEKFEALKQEIAEQKKKIEQFELEETLRKAKDEMSAQKPLKRDKAAIKKDLDAARAQFRKDSSQMASGGLQALSSFAKLVKLSLEYGIKTASDFYKEFKDDFNGYTENEVKEAFENITKEENKKDPAKATVEEGKLKLPVSLVNGIIQQGLEDGNLKPANEKQTDAEKQKETEYLVDKVHESLTPEQQEQFSKRQVQDAISNYGEQRFPSADKLKKKRSELNRDLQLASAEGDAKSGTLPSKSGFTPAPATDTQRAARKRINDLLKDFPQDAADIEKHYKTAQDRIEKALKYRVGELKTQITAKERLVRNENKVEDTIGINLLREEVKALEKELVDLVGKKEIPIEQRVNNAIKAMDALAEKYKTKTINKDFDPVKKESLEETAKRAGKSKEFETSKKNLDQAREAFSEAKSKSNPDAKSIKATEQAQKSAQRVHNKLIADLKANNLEYTKRKTLVIETANLKALREANKALRELREKAREAAGIAEKRRLELFKKNARKRLAEMDARLKKIIATGDPQEVVKKRTMLDDEAKRLAYEKEKAKYDIDVQLEKIRLENRNGFEIIGDAISNSLNAFTGMAASVDVSGGFRQGLQLSISNPKAAIKAQKDQVKAMFSKGYDKTWYQELHDSEMYPIMLHHGLYIAEPTAKLSAKEERAQSNIPEKIPVYGHIAAGSNRGYNMVLNSLRAQIFTDFYKMAKDAGLEGKELDDELDAMARFINHSSGRGDFNEKYAGAATLLNGLMFSPRYTISRANLLITALAVPFDSTLGVALRASVKKATGKEMRVPEWMNTMSYHKTPLARKEALRTLGNYTAVVMGILALAKFGFGGDDDDDIRVETNPTSSDFWKIRIGNLRIDLGTGLLQFIVLAARIKAGEKKQQDIWIGGEYKEGDMIKHGGDYYEGEKVILRGEGSTSTNLIDAGLDFFDNKLSPAAKIQKQFYLTGKLEQDSKFFGSDTFFGYELGKRGDPVKDSWKGLLLSGTSPMWTSDVKDLYAENSHTFSTIMTTANLFGIGVNVQDNQDNYYEITNEVLHKNNILISTLNTKKDEETGKDAITVKGVSIPVDEKTLGDINKEMQEIMAKEIAARVEGDYNAKQLLYSEGSAGITNLRVRGFNHKYFDNVKHMEDEIDAIKERAKEVAVFRLKLINGQQIYRKAEKEKINELYKKSILHPQK